MFLIIKRGPELCFDKNEEGRTNALTKMKRDKLIFIHNNLN